MALNLLWIIFFLLSFVTALIRLIFFGDTEIFKTMVDGIFDSAGTSVQIAIGLIGVMALFLGFLNIGEKAGAVNFLSRIIGPFFHRLFPEVPKNHPSMGHMVMNFSANLLGLDNAATPFGLKAMKSLQELNPSPDTASNAQIMFMVLHASGLTIIPVSIIAQRAILKSNDPTSIFIPCMIATFAATLVALSVVAFKQKINLFQPVILLWVGGISVLIGLLVFFLRAHSSYVDPFSKVFSNGLILLLFVVFIIWRHGQADKCLRNLHRRRQARFSGGCNHYSLFGGHVSRHQCVAQFRHSGMDHSGDRFFFSYAGCQYRFRSGTANCPDASIERRRRQGYDDFHDDPIWTGFLRGPFILRISGDR